MIELAIAVTVGLLILFGIIEFGLMFKDLTVLQQGARLAGIGHTTTNIITTIKASAPTLDQTKMAFSLKYSTDGGSAYTPLGNSGSANNAPSGSLIKVHAIYQRKWLTGFIFRGGKQISSAAVTRRE